MRRCTEQDIQSQSAPRGNCVFARLETTPITVTGEGWLMAACRRAGVRPIVAFRPVPDIG